MKLSDLSPDAKFALAQELSGPDLVRLCATDQSMRQICATSKYNPIWIKLLKKDYDIDYKGNNGYMEYLQNTYFLNKPYYVITFVDDEHPEESDEAILCRTRKEAYNRIKEYINEKVENYGEPDENKSYIEIKTDIERTGHTVIFGVIIYLAEAKFESEPVKDYEEEYETGLKSIAKKIYPNDEEKQTKFISDFNEIVMDQLEEDGYIDKDIIMERIREELIPNNKELTFSIFSLIGN